MPLGGFMEGGESVLDAIFEEDNLEDAQDIEMLDVEEGELVEQTAPIDLGENAGRDANIINQDSRSKNPRRRNKKRKNKRKKGSSGPDATDINRKGSSHWRANFLSIFYIRRFVLDVCKRLKEKKSYLVYTAVGVLGVSALSDIVKECARMDKVTKDRAKLWRRGALTLPHDSYAMLKGQKLSTFWFQLQARNIHLVIAMEGEILELQLILEQPRADSVIPSI
ncbi:unnamed protein product [Ilex paraguariensis]|uniref:DNA/RNA-binding protein Alba-like domain-containing protein n=1 Tax=Ilex paraguariensis TaxID=185542 RepID=A0ABC8RTH6_9AQUA